MSAPTAPRPKVAGPLRTLPPVSADDASKAKRSIAKLDEVLAMVTKALLTLGGGALIFTCVNVTRFGVSHEIPWYIAWMLDPLASLALITVLYVDGVLAEHGGDYKPGGWPFLLRWTAGLSTWVMNCWTSLYPDGHFHFIPQKPDAGGILLHSVAPALLILLAEAATGYRKYATRRRGELTAIIARFDSAKAAERETAEKRAREEAEREAAAKRAKAEREEKTKREAAEREAARREREEIARLENERRTAESEAAERTRRAEIETERERLQLQERAVEIEAARRKTDAEIEAQKRRQQWELTQAELDRETSRQAELTTAEAQAEALRKEAEAAAEAERIKAEAEARALEEAERAKRQRALERAAARTRPASETGEARASISAGRASESGAALSAVPALTASENGVRVPREVREKQRDEAERYIAKCALSGIAPDLERLGNQYGKGETWVGDRVRTARRRLTEEDGFEASVISDALDVFEDNSDNAGAA
ncbi:pinin family protein [Streptomyces atratus]|uniref:pinin family protein n=1 Tax=Streptomyces atratus TaxID=1893 RepID=UPI0021A7D439|nr:pinin family protein [Streptomyces atratus]MCT2546251.1 pinin family protein [Streptomyces atratus]